jgi:hypothetical protein
MNPTTAIPSTTTTEPTTIPAIAPDDGPEDLVCSIPADDDEGPSTTVDDEEADSVVVSAVVRLEVSVSVGDRLVVVVSDVDVVTALGSVMLNL